MATIKVSLPNALRALVDDQVGHAGFRTSGEYVRTLIRREQQRQHLRSQLLDGAKVAPTGDADAAYFAALRSRAAFGTLPKRKA